MPWSPVSDWRNRVNLDIEPETSDLRTNEHKEMGNHLNKEVKKYDGSDENEEDGVENEEIIPLRHLHYLFGVSEEYESEEAEESEVSEESEGSEESEESEESEDDEGSEVSEESEDEGEEEDDEEILHFHQLHYPVDEGSEEGEGKEGEGSENDEGEGKEGEGSENDEGEEIPHFHHLHYLLDGASEEDDEEESEEWEVSEEWEGEENEGCEDDGLSEVWEDEGTKENEGEDERCESSGCFIWGKTFIPHLIREEHEVMRNLLDREGEKNKKGSEEWEGIKEACEEGSEECEIGEQGIEDGKEAGNGEDERCEASGCFKWLMPHLISEEHQEMRNLLDREGEGSKEVSEKGGGIEEGSEEHEEDEQGSEDEEYLVTDLADYVEQLPLSANKMLCNLSLEIYSKKENTDQLQSKYEEKTMAIRKILEEKDETQHTFFEEARNLLCIAGNQSKRVLEQQEMVDFDFENKRQRLNSWSEELNKREAALTEEKRKMDDHYLAKERQRNDELLEAGKELMKGLEDMPSHCRVKIGVKRRGEINEEAFMSACKKKYLPHEAETKAVELCSFLEEKMRDLKWHPFQFVEYDKGVPQKVLNENDKVLRGLKDESGDDIYNAVVAALENNTSGNGMDTELWNFEEDRKASHCEVIRYIFSQWKTLQCKRDKIVEVIRTLI